MGYSIAYNSGSTTPFGTFKQGTITMGLKPQEYTVSSGFTWYANAETPNDNYLIISDTYSQGWSTQAESKPTIWRSETGTTESFVALVNQLPDVNGVTGFTDSGTAMKYLMDSGKYFVNKDDYLGIVSDGLVLNLDAGWYPSYSGSGTTWKDIKGSNNGTLTNGPTFSSGSIVFDGSDDYVKVPINLIYSQGTISCWVYPKSTGDNFFVYTDNNPTSTYTHQLGISSSNKLHAYIFQNGVKQFDGTSTMNTNEWHHCVFWWKDGVAFGSYLNGISQGSQTIGTAWKSGSNFWIGSNSGGANLVNGYLNGNISNLQIYNKQLTETEILQNYNATKGRFGL